MLLATRSNLVWLGMVLSGIALGFYVLTSWPDTSPQVIRLPYGEVMPKTPRAAAPAQELEITAAPAAPEAQAQAEVELTALETASEADREPASLTPTDDAAAPEESAYELGGTALPGSERATPKPAAQKQGAAAPAPAAPAPAAPAAEPEPSAAPEEPPMLEIVIGSAPPSSGPE